MIATQGSTALKTAVWLGLGLAAWAVPAVGTAAATGFATPLFGLSTGPDDNMLVADAGAGIVQLRKGEAHLLASLPGITDVEAIGAGNLLATRGGGNGLTTGALFRVTRGKTRLLADLYGFEAAVNPHPATIDSNPYDVERGPRGSAVVADAAANDLLSIDSNGTVDWIATLPNELVSSANLKTLAGCPTPSAGNEGLCALPPMMPAQAVTASVAIGPDGAYYLGELKGFPGPVGESRIWRIAPGAHHAVCGSSPDCQVVFDGFTSIIDLNFGPDGRLYVVELDEASWASIEMGFTPIGGTVNACDLTTHECEELMTGLMMPIATTFSRDGSGHVAINALIPGAATVIPLTGVPKTASRPAAARLTR